MDYKLLALELLELRIDFMKSPVEQMLSKIMKGECFVMNYLETHEDVVHPKELSENMSVSTARIATLLKQLEDKNLIRRIQCKNDNRQIEVELTELGEAEIQRLRQKALDLAGAMLEKLGPEDAVEYMRILRKIHDGQYVSE